LLDSNQVQNYMREETPSYIFMLAANYGGILACKKNPGKYLYNNSVMALNVINSAYEIKSNKLVYVSSSVIYPKNSPQPFKEDCLLNGKLDENTEGYALAKILGVKLCQLYNKQYGINFFSAVPPNMYGPFDRFYDNNANVLSSIITKIHEAKMNNKESVELFGTGKPKREFLFVDDFSDALIFLAKNFEGGDNINVGSGEETSIAELAQIVKEVIEYEGEIIFNPKYPDGVMRKILDSSKINSLGWQANTSLKEGIIKTYDWFSNYYKSKGDF